MALVSNLVVYPLTIANGTALSPALPLGATRMVGIVMPAAWTAAGLSFQMSPDGGATWSEITDTTGAAVSMAVAAAVFVQINPAAWVGTNMLKIRSGTSGVPVNQGADRILQIIADSGIW